MASKIMDAMSAASRGCSRPSVVSDEHTLPSLPRAVLGGGHQLTRKAREDIITLSGARPLRFLTVLVTNWLAIAALIALGVYADSWVVTGVCIVLIGWRQLVLGLLLHDQVHRLGLRGKYGDWIVNCLAAYPILVTTVEDYAKVHLMHHKYFFTERDPDHIRKSGAEWAFPMPLRRFMGIIARDLTGINTVRVIRGKTAPKNADEFTRRNPTPVWLRVIFWVMCISAISVFGGWYLFLVYWILPLLTTFQLALRWIAVTEHIYNAENALCLDVTPLIELRWWQKLIFPDLNFALHAYHHEHPGVPFGNLPKVHEIYKREGLVNEAAVFHGQGAYLKFLIAR